MLAQNFYWLCLHQHDKINLTDFASSPEFLLGAGVQSLQPILRLTLAVFPQGFLYCKMSIVCFLSRLFSTKTTRASTMSFTCLWRKRQKRKSWRRGKGNPQWRYPERGHGSETRRGHPFAVRPLYDRTISLPTDRKSFKPQLAACRSGAVFYSLHVLSISLIHTSPILNPSGLRKDGLKVRWSFLITEGNTTERRNWRLFGLRWVWLWTT